MLSREHSDDDLGILFTRNDIFTARLLLVYLNECKEGRETINYALVMDVVRQWAWA
jgi:hypothetical protein